jgi:hypothetical protein
MISPVSKICDSKEDCMHSCEEESRFLFGK